MLIPRFANGVPSTDIGFQKFAGRFMDIGMRVGMLIRQGYVPMFSTCSKTRRRLKESEDGVNFGTGKNNWNVAVAFGANDTVDFTKFPMQNMAEEEQQGVKGLVLRGGGGPVLHGQRGEEAADFLVADL